MPTDDELDEMSMKIAGVTFAQLGAEHRVMIMQLAIAANTSTDMQLITEHLAVVAQHGADIAIALGGNSDVNGVTDYLGPICDWFEKSRSFDGIPT